MLDPLRRVYHRLTREKPASYMEVERAERIFYLTYLREGMVAFDVGANLGEITLLFSRFVGVPGRVHAFEPSPAAYELLAAVCGTRARGNVVLNQVAVGDANGVIALHVYGGSHATLTTAADRNVNMAGEDVRPEKTIDVPQTTLDAYCRTAGVEHIDLLKIDVEGLEYKVLLGARRLFEERRVRCCVFEYGATTHDAGAAAEQLEAFFRSCSYQVRNVIAGAKAFPGRERPQSAHFSMHVATPR
jgi:FkbM family methyltransferase